MEIWVSVRGASRGGGHHIVKLLNQGVFLRLDGWDLLALLSNLLHRLRFALAAPIVWIAQNHRRVDLLS